MLQVFFIDFGVLAVFPLPVKSSSNLFAKKMGKC